MFHSRRAPEPTPFNPRHFLGVFRYSQRAISLVWETSKPITLGMAVLTLVGGALPAVIAYVGKLIVDAVLHAAQTGLESDLHAVLWLVLLEGGIVAINTGIERVQTMCQTLLRALLGQRVNVLILEKAQTLNLSHFEDSEFYDRLTQARREASQRPLSLVNRTAILVRNGISLVSYGALLLAFSPLAVLLLAIAGLPVFFSETYFSGEAFRLFRWRSPETRQRTYLEVAMAREDFAKEVQLYGLGPTFLKKYKEIFNRVFREDKRLTVRRGIWGYLLGLLSTFAFYGAYGWIVYETVNGVLTLGEMTMYLVVFRQGQTSFSLALQAVGGMYEDNLYLANLYEFLDEPVPKLMGEVAKGPKPGDGIRFDDVWFTYPGSEKPALCGVSFQLKPGQKLALVGENGSGKTTLVKLLTRLYEPQKGRITLDGVPLEDWGVDALRRRIGVIFQDFVRYQFSFGENIGVGDVDAMDDRDRWAEAAEKGMALPLLQKMPDGYDTQLGKWFFKGQELSGGQWQKIALSRAFMRKSADILVLDEPTSAMDARAESEIFDRIREVSHQQMAVLISHRFSTVRMADSICVLQNGQITEMGTHEELMENGGVYAQLFTIQARGYR